MLLGKGKCVQKAQARPLSDVLMVIPESLDRRAEGSNYVGKGYGLGAPQF